MQLGYGGDHIKQKEANVHFAILGLHFQADGSYTNHISNILEKACKILNILDYGNMSTIEILIKLYFSFIRCI